MALAGGLLVGLGAVIGATGDEPAGRVPAIAGGQQASCRNSSEPACGPFRWDPQPTNRPMTIIVRPSTTTARVGETVVFDVEATDDTKIDPGDCGNISSFGDEEFGEGGCDVDCLYPPRYGPWDPPAPTEGRITERFAHAYQRPGTYQARFTYHSGDRCTRDPYVSEDTGMVTITVTTAPVVLPVSK